MEEIEGIEVAQSPKAEEIQEICQRMCSWERYIIYILYDFHIWWFCTRAFKYII